MIIICVYNTIKLQDIRAMLYGGIIDIVISFPAVHKAYKQLEDPDQIEYCKGIWEEAIATVDQRVIQLVYLIYFIIYI